MNGFHPVENGRLNEEKRKKKVRKRGEKTERREIEKKRKRKSKISGGRDRMGRRNSY